MAFSEISVMSEVNDDGVYADFSVKKYKNQFCDTSLFYKLITNKINKIKIAIF